MKIKARSICLCSLLAFAWEAYAQQGLQGYDIIVLAGQSNMLGRDGYLSPSERLVMTTSDGFQLVSVEVGVPDPFSYEVNSSRVYDNIETVYRPLRQPFFRYIVKHDVWGWSYEGPSPGATFVQRYVDQSLQRGRSVIVVTAAMSGRGIAEFDPQGGQFYARMVQGTRAALRFCPQCPSPSSTPSPAASAVANATAANNTTAPDNATSTDGAGSDNSPATGQSPLSSRVVALLWLQGESDGVRWGDEAVCSYWGRLRAIVTSFRTEFGDVSGENIAFIAGELSKAFFGGAYELACSSLDLARLAVHTLGASAYPEGANATAVRQAEALPNAALASSAGLFGRLYAPLGPVIRDEVHFSASSLLEAGRRFHEAYAWLRQPPVRGALAAWADPPLPTMRPPHPCHWSTAPSVSGPWESETFNASALPARSPLWLLLRLNLPGVWHVANTPAQFRVRIVQWDGSVNGSSAASFALRTGLRSVSDNSSACSCEGSTLDSSESTAFVTGSLPAAESAGSLATPRCGYAFVDGVYAPRSGLEDLGYDSSPLSPHSRFTPHRTEDGAFYVEPLFSPAGLIPRTNGPFGTGNRVMGATPAHGGGGLWVPVHSAVGYPTDGQRRAAEAAGRPFVALIKSEGFTPRLNSRRSYYTTSDVTMESLLSRRTLAVRLPSPPVLTPSGSPTATRTATCSRTRTATRTRTISATRSKSNSRAPPAVTRSRTPKRKRVLR